MKTPSRLIILLAGLVLCTVCGVLYAWSIFVVPLEQAFGWQRPETSLTFTFMITFFSLGMFAGGKLLRFGPARAVQIGGALLCVGLLWASRIGSVIGLYLSYGVVSGFGIGIVNLVPAAVCLRWYPERKGLVSGLLTMALALGTLLFGTVGAGWLIGKVGVSSTFMALAVLFLGIIVLGSLFLRMPEAAPGKEEGDGVGLRDMLHTPSYWMIWGWMLTIQIGGLMIIGHIVPYALECGLTAAQAGLGMGVYAIANGVGRLFFGYVHDLFGRAWGMGLDAVFMGCGLVLLAGLPSRVGMAGVPVWYGPCGGSGGPGVRRDHSPACGFDHGLFRAAPLRGELRVQHEPAYGRLGVRAVHRRPDPGMVRRLPRGPLCGCGHNPAGRRPGGRAQGKGP